MKTITCSHDTFLAYSYAFNAERAEQEHDTESAHRNHAGAAKEFAAIAALPYSQPCCKDSLNYHRARRDAAAARL